MRREEAIAKLRETEATLRATGVDALYLFGSVARDEGRAASDIDVFVDPQSDDNFGFLQFMTAYDAIRRVVGEGINVGYSTRSGLSPYVRAAAEREAIRVF
jgi:predicted nucleotidyltransferase